MTHLHIAAIVASHLATLCLGIFVGCLIGGDRKDTGLLSGGIACVFAVGALTFWLV